jgi:head-tail adaptor
MLVTIEQVSEERTTSGGQTLRWTEIGKRWARFIPKTAQEFSVAQHVAESVDWLIHMRGYLYVTTRSRIVHDGRYFDIVGVLSDDGKPPISSPMLTILLKEGPHKAGV